MCGRIGPELKSLEGKDENLCGMIRPDFQCLEGHGQNSYVWKGRAKKPILGRIRNELQC